MSLLKELKVVSSKRPVRLSPVVHRRNKLIKKLFQQEQCAEAIIDGKDCLFTRGRLIRDKETGLKAEHLQRYRIKPWWYVTEDADLIFEIRYGSRSIEITKGKTGIEVDGMDKLVETIRLLIKAVGAGELDEGIAALVGTFGRQIKKK